jgi:hypothetical protein
MSLEFYCRTQRNFFFFNLNYWGSIVGGVLRDKEMGHIVGNAAMTLFGAPSSG